VEKMEINKTLTWLMAIMLALIFVAVLLPIGIEEFMSAGWSAIGLDDSLVTLITVLVPLAVVIAIVVYFVKQAQSQT
jgi:uncharacterized membrane protein